MYLDSSCCRLDEAKGVLHVTTPWSGEKLRLLPWEAGCTLEILRSAWQTHDAEFSLLGAMPGTMGPEHPITRYVASVPEEVRLPLAQYTFGQLQMLQVCARSERAVQLLHASPNLLWFIAPFLMAHVAHDKRELHAVLGYKRPALLDMAGGRSEGWVVRLLESFGPVRRNSAARTALRVLMNTPEALETLRHRKTLSWEIACFAAERAHYFAGRVARSIFRESENIATAQRELHDMEQLLRDVQRLGHTLAILDLRKLLLACGTYPQLQQLHDAWTRRLNGRNNQMAEVELGRSLPPPPFAGTKDIVPLTTAAALHEEGARMHHCVGSYVSAVRKGNCYIYKVLFPERATVEIRYTSRNGWVVRQIKKASNNAPNAETVRIVHAWLAHHTMEQYEKEHFSFDNGGCSAQFL